MRPNPEQLKGRRPTLLTRHRPPPRPQALEVVLRCSREQSRHARHALREYLLPAVERLRYPLHRPGCPLAAEARPAKS